MGPAWEKDPEDVLIVPESGHVNKADQNLGFPWCRSSARQHSTFASKGGSASTNSWGHLSPPNGDVPRIVQRVERQKVWKESPAGVRRERD